MCATKAKAPSTTERCSSAFQTFKEWSSCFEEIACLPSDDEMSFAPYLEFFATAEFSHSTLESACYGINWAHHRFVISRVILIGKKCSRGG